MTDEEFLLLVEGFMHRYHLSPTTFGILAMDDPKFVFKLREGRASYAKTMIQVRRYMEQHGAKQRARSQSGSAV
ncbi:MAG: hypothetical protein QM783_15955 [Phycisphaerales bacterium]